jgi:hypothetical protein
MRSWSFWRRELKKRLLLGPEDDGIGTQYGNRIRLRLPRGSSGSGRRSGMGRIRRNRK